jgi:hypothetical protein
MAVRWDKRAVVTVRQWPHTEYVKPIEKGER